MSKIKSVVSTLIAGLAVGVSTAAHAGYFTSTITAGVNKYEDQSREAYIDVNGDGYFSVGDVLVGFARIDDKTAGGGGPLTANAIYTVFSQEVLSISGNTVVWGPTTVSGLQLKDLGVTGAGVNDMVAVYSRFGGYAVDLITTSPGNVGTSGAVTLKDYINYVITNGSLDMLVGLTTPNCGSSATNNCFQATSPLAGAANGNLINTASGITIANFVAGLDVTKEPVGWDITPTTDAGTFYTWPLVRTAELAISNGAVSGTFNVANAAEWMNASELTSFRQCSPLNENGSPNLDASSVPCGFVNDLDFNFEATRIPEPATLGLLGLSVLGMGFVARRRRG